ncbi:guanylate kinase [Enterococcus thailandicus]|uniref:guanylate kinase n=1 Tax=Enterococcus thailandicus TaxID=417368 RepID=UPI0039A4E109
MTHCYVIIGPSGSGKTSLAASVFRPDQKIITHTSRSKRPSEQNEKDYYFISKKIFKEMISDGAFAEWDEYAGNYYGSSKLEIENRLKKADCYAVLTASGFWRLHEIFGERIRPIFISISKETLQKRLEDRGDSQAERSKRLALFERDQEELQRLTSIPTLAIISNDTTFESAQRQLVKVLQENTSR